jgi:homoserine kinase type II
MALFRTLSEKDLTEILRGFGIDGYRGHSAIAVGTINTNIRVETVAGPLFLRINEGKSRHDVEREAAIVLHVAARGVPTPAPLSTPAGLPFVQWRGQLVSLFPWLAGRTLFRSALSPVHARKVGRALAALHLAGADLPDHRPGRYEPDEIDSRMASIASAGDPSLAAVVLEVGSELAQLRGQRRNDLPLGLIHGDLFIDNVLYDGEDLVALLDFEQSSWGKLAYDLAVTTLAFGFGADDFRADVVAALFAGYTSLRQPTAEERAGFAAELRFAACRFTVTRITDVHLKRSGGAAPGKDYRRYLTRLRKVRERLADPADHVLSLL